MDLARQPRTAAQALFLLVTLAAVAPLAAANPSALQAIQDQDYKQALTLLDQALAEATDDTGKLYFLRGGVHLRLGQAQAALDDLHRADGGDDPQLLDHYLGLAWLLHGRDEFAAGRYQSAYAAYTEAGRLAAAEVQPQAAYWQGLTLARLQRQDEAVARLRQLLTTQPDEALAQQTRTTLHDLEHGGDQERRFHFNLQVGLAVDSNVALLANNQAVPLSLSKRADVRLQAQFDASYQMVIAGIQTQFSYNQYQSQYSSVPGYNLQSQGLAVDARLPHNHGNWGVNLQSAGADLDSNGEHTNTTLTAYHTYSISPRQLSLAHLSYSADDFSASALQGYNGSRLLADWRYYLFSDGSRRQLYLGAQVGSQGRLDPALGNSVLGVNAGILLPGDQWDLGVAAALDNHAYPAHQDTYTELRSFLVDNITRNHSVEVGFTLQNNLSTDPGLQYERHLFYMLTRWYL